jgi:hypothetical protein
MASAQHPSTPSLGAFGLLVMPMAHPRFLATDLPARHQEPTNRVPSTVALSALAARLRQLAAERKAAR